MTMTVSPNGPIAPAAQQAVLDSYLRRLRLPAVLAQYARIAQEAAQAGCSYEQFLLTLTELESLMPQLNKPLVLELARGHYLDAKENILLVGQIGTGKTHVATALGVAACRQGARVRFLTAAGLVNELLEAQATHRLSRYEQGLLRLHLLILDEVGFIPFTKLGADLLFSVLSALHEQVSLIITTTVPFADWATLFGGDQRLAAALLDRLTFHAHLLQFTGESFRLRQSLKRQAQEHRRG